MNDDRIFTSLRTALDERVDPDAPFADGLYEMLTVELGLSGAAGPAGVGIVARLARALGLRRHIGGPPAARLAYVASLGVLLLVFTLATVLIAGHLLQRNPILTGDEIAQRSQALYSSPPAFDMTVQFASIRIVRFRYDGGGQLRTDVIAGSFYASPEGPGSFRVDTATQTATYDAGRKSWNQADVPAGLPPLISMFPLNWIVQARFQEPQQLSAKQPSATPPGYDCPSGWQREADGLIADRPAFHVTCGSDADFWIDQQSLLVDGSGSLIAATSLTIGPTPDSSLFALAMPAGAYDANNPPPSTVLGVGQPAPDWTGSLQGGGTFDSRSLRGAPAALYFWAEWCDPCIGSPLNSFGNAARSHPGIGFVSVALDPANEAALRAAIEASGAGYPVVRDDIPNPITAGWGLAGVPTLVLLRADGSVASVTLGPLSSRDLNAMLVALVAGEPIPSPAETPELCTCSTAPASEASAKP